MWSMRRQPEVRAGGMGNPRAFANRCPLLHLKDMAANAERSFAPVGSGTLDWPAIIFAARQANVRWGIVEQDTCAGDPVECLATSL